MSAGIAIPAPAGGRVLRATTLTALATGLAGTAVGRAVVGVLGDPETPWLLGRAAGLTAYALLVALVCTGLLLAHPAAARFRRPHPAVRLRLHAGLAAFTLAFVVLHVVVLATDRYARVGWSGSIVPFASAYRPLPVTLGVLAAYSGLVAGATATLAGRLGTRLWWRIHRLSGLCLVLVWFHGVLTGSDTTALRALYVGSGVLVAALAMARHLARPTLVRP